MKHSIHQLLKITCVLIFLSATVTQCKPTKKEAPSVDPAFTTYVAGFTSGIISSESTIRVRLQEAIPVNEEKLNASLFRFSPKIKGDVVLIDAQTIGFRPAEPLPSGAVFDAEFQLGDLITVPEKLSVLPFQFKVKNQAVQVVFNNMEAYPDKDLSKQKLRGLLTTADVADNSLTESVLVATQSGNELPVSWQHSENRSEHFFTVDSVSRTGQRGEVILRWKGKPIGAEDKGEMKIEIPALGDFKVMDAKYMNDPEPVIRLAFSDPVSESQELDGLIFLKSAVQLRFVVEGNVVNAYPQDQLNSGKQVVVADGVRNRMGYPLSERFEKEISFSSLKPNVELIGNGVILPGSQGLIFPFKAVNLSAVNVKVIRIFEKNIPQFFQVNQFDGSRELNRVGRLVLKKTIPLVSDKNIDYGQWNTFSLDLSKLIETEPGAMYRVMINFDRSMSLYPCGNDEPVEETTQPQGIDPKEETRYDSPDYYYYDDYDYEYDSDYQWNERENPCKPSYYMFNNHAVARNVIASNLGIIVKGGDDQSFTVAVTDLNTTAPLSDVEVSFYNLQNQLLASGKTNGNGLLTIPLDKKPFLLIARKGNQTGYLRVDDGSALSLSMFDISGEKTVKGVKGHIYGERGVWRPGDSIYVAFVLEDKNKALPANHPVIFELFTPENILYQKKIKTSSVNGFYDFRTATSPEARTGNWLAKVTVGGSTFTQRLKIETVKPNRLKIGIDFKTSILKSNTDIRAALDAKWLHGAIAKKLDADMEMTLSEGQTKFDNFADFVFDDPSKKFTSEAQKLFKGQLDERGKAEVPFKLQAVANAPGMLNANFNIRVFEKGGDFSTDRFTMPFSPYSSYVGLKVPKGPGWNDALYSNEPNLIPIVTVDENGRPVDRKKVEIKIYELGWRWWWERADGDDLARYIANESSRLLTTTYIDTKNGKAIYEMNLGTESWGRKLIRVTDPVSKHSAGTVFYTSYKGWWNNAGQGNPGGAEMLTFSTDKKSYRVGEKVQVELPASQNGKALVSIESGSRVVDAFWVETSKEKSSFNFTATPEMAPNVYIHLSYIQPHNQTVNDLPIRMYGVQPISVEDPDTRLQPVIQMPEVLEPEGKVRIKVKEQNGRKMAFTLAVVDEGLLDLTRFATPDLWKKFYAREALGIKTWDLYQYVMGALSGEMAGLLALGGDEAIIGKAGKKPNRFKPVVKYFGPFELDAKKTQTIEFEMPNYVGSVRTMVIAGNNGAYGSAEKTTPVKKPLMVVATLPRVLSPSEQVKLPVTVFAMDKKVKTVSVEIQANELFKLNDSGKKQITFSEEGDQTVYFDLSVLEKIGAGKVNVTVRSGSEKASYDIEMEVRVPNPHITQVTDGLADPGKSWESNFAPVGLKGTNSGVVEVSSIPSLDLDKRLNYLIRYPHGCIEQTVSSVFPQLHLDALTQLSEGQKTQIEQNIKAAIKKMKEFQLNNGGLSYWPGEYTLASDWGTSYAGHFMLEAKAKGYSLPAGFLDNWTKFQLQMANNWTLDSRANQDFRESSQLIQAYRLYTLALAGKPALGAMNRMREITQLGSSAAWRLAAAYKLAGRNDVAESMVAKLSTQVKIYNELSGSYGSAERDQAMILETLVLLNKRTEAKKLLEELASKLASDNWYNTQTTAYSLLAVAKFAGNADAESGLTFEYEINKKKERYSTKNMLARIPLDEFLSSPGKIKISNPGNKVLFVKVLLEGIPLTGDPVSEERDLSFSIRYLDMDGKVIDPARLAQGTDFMAEVQVHHPGLRANYQEMALTQIFPSGWEIRNLRMEAGPSVHITDKPRYMDIRDDRVFSYFDLAKNQTKTFRVLLNAAYPGKFYLPSVYCEAMYDHSIHARKAGQWVEVVKEE